MTGLCQPVSPPASHRPASLEMSESWLSHPLGWVFPIQLEHKTKTDEVIHKTKQPRRDPWHGSSCSGVPSVLAFLSVLLELVPVISWAGEALISLLSSGDTCGTGGKSHPSSWSELQKRETNQDRQGTKAPFLSVQFHYRFIPEPEKPFLSGQRSPAGNFGVREQAPTINFNLSLKPLYFLHNIQCFFICASRKRSERPKIVETILKI